MGPGCRILRGLGHRRAIAGGLMRGLAVGAPHCDEHVDMPWKIGMLIQACIHDKMEVKRL